MLASVETYRETPIEAREAWQTLDRWRSTGQEIGIIFWSRSTNLYTLAVVESAHNGRIELQGKAVRVSFHLAEASFKYGPMPTWPRWPSPPIVEVTALRAEFENGDYLALAEGLTPPVISSPALKK
jgi:hypothetical protein